MKVLIILLIVIILIPVPIKISMVYSRKDYYIKIYKFKVFYKRNQNLKKTVKNSTKKTNGKKFKKEKKENFFSYIKDICYSKKFLSSFVKNLKYNRFKPTIKINCLAEYSLGDSADTAIFYGIIHSFFPYMYKFIALLLKIKNSTINVTPIFRDLKFLNITYKSIIFCSLGQVIIICFIFLKTIFEVKEVSPFRGNYE